LLIMLPTLNRLERDAIYCFFLRCTDIEHSAPLVAITCM
jgi:hypothetical protein